MTKKKAVKKPAPEKRYSPSRSTVRIPLTKAQFKMLGPIMPDTPGRFGLFGQVWLEPNIGFVEEYKSGSLVVTCCDERQWNALKTTMRKVMP